VSLTVVFRETALRSLAHIRREDKEAFTQIRGAIADLADQPVPDGATAWGGTGIFRLHAGTARILYEIDEDASAVYIINVARIA
jgi:mRNA-degrading endonuclease RelE of RelBE toxin-antitoxin system